MESSKLTKLMRLLICIDDTDNLDSKGTGAIAEELRDLIAERGWGTCGDITQHQLLLHEDIPYTSHNSSTVDGVKRRAGTGLGRCQGSFCTSEIINILAKELGVSPANINKDEKGSFIVTGSVV